MTTNARNDGSRLDADSWPEHALPEDDGSDPLALFEAEGVPVQALVEDTLPTPAPTRRALRPVEPALPPERSALPVHDAIALDEVLKRLGHVHWSEGVAIVEALCATLAAQGSRSVPEMSRIALTAVGGVAVSAGRGSVRDEDAGPGLARTLHGLAAGGAVPAPLRLFVTQWASTKGDASIEAFAEGLAHFARPDGASLIRAVYSRALAAARLVAAPAAAPRGLSRTPWTRALALRTRYQRQLMAAAAVLAVILTVLVWRTVSPPVLPSDRVVPASDASATVEASPPPGVEALRTLSPTGSPLAGGRGRGGQQTGSTAGGAGSVNGRLSPAARPAGSAGAVPARPVGGATPESAGAALAPQTEMPPDDPGRIYSKSDADVIPPTLRQQQLPAPILGGRPFDVNTLELIVSETGVVERVRLLSTPKRMSDMMLLSGAKAWEFEPATRQGRRVRYRLEMSWAATP